METTRSLSKSTSSSTTVTTCSDDDGLSELRRGPWTAHEDSLLMHYISCHGEGRWNSLAESSGLKRSGKSCRLRWLNYLKPDVKRGNLSPEEQLLILDLHSKWGNRWSKIAQYLPGRTDNEIKNYWRTRVQKHARHLKIDANSIEFQKLVRTVWMPRLIQKLQDHCPNSIPDSLSSPPAPASNVVPYGSENQQQVFNTTDGMSSSEFMGNFSSAYQFGNNLDGHFQNECSNVGGTTGCETETLSLAADYSCSGGHHVQANWLSDEMGWSNFDEFFQWKQPKERHMT